MDFLPAFLADFFLPPFLADFFFLEEGAAEPGATKVAPEPETRRHSHTCDRQTEDQESNRRSER